jgi:hypothetical protein
MNKPGPGGMASANKQTVPSVIAVEVRYFLDKILAISGTDLFSLTHFRMKRTSTAFRKLR